MDGRLLGRNGFRRDGRAVFGARGQGLHGGRLLHGFGRLCLFRRRGRAFRGSRGRSLLGRGSLRFRRSGGISRGSGVFRRFRSLGGFSRSSGLRGRGRFSSCRISSGRFRCGRFGSSFGDRRSRAFLNSGRSGRGSGAQGLGGGELELGMSGQLGSQPQVGRLGQEDGEQGADQQGAAGPGAAG